MGRRVSRVGGERNVMLEKTVKEGEEWNRLKRRRKRLGKRRRINTNTSRRRRRRKEMKKELNKDIMRKKVKKRVERREKEDKQEKVKCEKVKFIRQRERKYFDALYACYGHICNVVGRKVT